MSYQRMGNYETWAVKLWIDNEEPSYRYWREVSEDIADANTLAKRLKDEHEEALPNVEGFAADLLNAAFGEVDWYEIAESLMDESKKATG